MAALDEPRTAHLPLAPPTRFLQAHEAVGERVALASYPRSGNSLLRKLVEQATASSRAPTHYQREHCRKRSRTVRRAGRGRYRRPRLAREDALSRDAALRRDWCGPRHFMVRNPWDAIDSYFNMALTNDHARTTGRPVSEI